MPNNIGVVWLGKWVDGINGYAQYKVAYFILEFVAHYVSSIWLMAIESIGIQNTPSSHQCDACHPYNIANYLQQNILWILGIIGMCLNILWGGPCALALLFDSLYLSCPYFGHISSCIFSSLENTIIGTWMIWYVFNTQHFQHFLCLFSTSKKDIIIWNYLIFE